MVLDLQNWLDFANGRFATGLLVFGRFGGMLFAAPMIGGKNVPNAIRLGLAAIMAVIVGSMLPAERMDNFPAMGAGLAKEILLGLVLGWSVTLIFASAQMAGEWLDMQGGFQAGHILNPAFETNNAPIGNMKYLLAGIVFLGVGGHAMMIRGAAVSFAISPPGALNLHLGGPEGWVGLVSKSLWIALQMAAPVGIALLLAEFAIGIMSRAVPQVNMMILTMPGKALLAVCGAAISIPVIAQVLSVICSNIQSDINVVMRMLGA
jgi:flagellar biosynthetic protein FliR